MPSPNSQHSICKKWLQKPWLTSGFIPMEFQPESTVIRGSFDNHIIEQLHKLYGIQQSTNTPYNPCGNSQCECFNCTLQNLLKMLPKDQKSNWPEHLSTLVFAYNATLHATTGYQPYQLMFGHKAPMPCDNCLGFTQYNNSESVSKNT